MVRVPGRRRRRERRPDRTSAMLEGARAGDRRPHGAALDRLALPELRGGALVGAAPAEPARRCSTHCSLMIEAGDATVVGEIDPLAYELVLQHRPRVARLFEVVRLAPMRRRRTRSRSRADWARPPGRRGRRRHARGGARPRVALPPRDGRARERASRCSSSFATGRARRRAGGDARDRDRDAERRHGPAAPRARSRGRRSASTDVRAYFDAPRARTAGGRRLPGRPDRAREGRAHRPDAGRSASSSSSARPEPGRPRSRRRSAPSSSAPRTGSSGST